MPDLRRIQGALTRFVVALCVAAMATTAAPVAAPAATVGQLKARLESIQDRYSAAGSAVDEALHKVDETDYRITVTKRKRAKAAKALKRAQRILGKRADRMYRNGAVGPLSVLVGATSFDDLSTRYDYLKRIGKRDARAVAAVKDRRAKLAAQQRRLDHELSARKADLTEVKDRRSALESQLQETRAEFEKARQELAAARARSAANRATPTAASNGGVIVSAGSNGMVFPVAGPNYYSDTFGAPRSGGRSHQGTDIMASTGVPVVAVTSGYVNAKNGGLGGKTIWLSGNGWSFYYAHLNGWAVTSGHVKAGQVIGYVGATGNASGGAPHLHFEMHPGGGGAVNPYPYLRAMQ
ncbi:MAG: peptidoglycan DD-metalloendopeptidase family protein [Coriobacteriales bacterium]|nr:peptidoglycan DD-metalloendopeptidase family protein [Coriobacteriales bacterium]